MTTLCFQFLKPKTCHSYLLLFLLHSISDLASIFKTYVDSKYYHLCCSQPGPNQHCLLPELGNSLLIQLKSFQWPPISEKNKVLKMVHKFPHDSPPACYLFDLIYWSLNSLCFSYVVVHYCCRTFVQEGLPWQPYLKFQYPSCLLYSSYHFPFFPLLF